MRRLTCLALTVLAVLPALPAAAQQSSELETQIQRKRVIALPKPDPAQVQRDAERAAADVEMRARERELIRESMEPVAPRPDLRYEVYSAIQQRNLRRAR